MVSDNIKTQKKELRSLIVQKRDSLNLSARAAMQNEICLRLQKLIQNTHPKIIHTFLPMGSEPDFSSVIRECLSNNIKVVCPEALVGGKLKNRVLKSWGAVVQGRFGTMHPSGENIYEGYYDLIIVPGLAFDMQGFRLGYGGGYYDRFLSKAIYGMTVGICYDFQILGTVPREAHDCRVDRLLMRNEEIK